MLPLSVIKIHDLLSAESSKKVVNNFPPFFLAVNGKRNQVLLRQHNHSICATSDFVKQMDTQTSSRMVVESS